MNKSSFTLILVAMLSLYVVAGISYLIMNLMKPEKIVKRIVEQETGKLKERIKVDIPSKPIFRQKAEPQYKSWAYNLTDMNFDRIKNSKYDLVILETEKDKKHLSENVVKNIKSTNKTVFAYVSLGQAEKYRAYWKSSWNKKLPPWMGDKNRIWKGVYDVNELTNQEWLAISYKIIDKVIENGFDGVLIAGLDDNKNQTEVANFVSIISKYAKSKVNNFKIFVQDTEELVNNKNFINNIDGVVRQSVYYEMLSTKPRSEKYINSVLENLKALRNKEKTVLIVEYVNSSKWDTVKSKISDNGFLGFNSNIKLNKI
jgi:cysteinyl-tRNA synthetase